MKSSIALHLRWARGLIERPRAAAPVAPLFATNGSMQRLLACPRKSPPSPPWSPAAMLLEGPLMDPVTPVCEFHLYKPPHFPVETTDSHERGDGLYNSVRMS